jgi:hypothetical protein
MSAYWIRQSASDDIQGPLRGSDVKKMAADGAITREWLISPDQQAWHRAGQIKGLFQSVAATVTQEPPAPVRGRTAQALPRSQVSEQPATRPSAANQQGSIRDANVAAAAMPASVHSEALPPPAPIGYFIPGSSGSAVGGVAPSSGVVIGFLVVASLMFVSGTICTAFAFLQNPIVAGVAAAALLLCDIPALILWLIWLYQAHRAVRDLSGGSYSISPGQAVGFSFIPVFSGFWIVYTPARLARQINQLTGEGTVSVPAVLAIQICSVVAALVFPGLTPLLYFGTMFLIQRSIKRMTA